MHSTSQSSKLHKMFPIVLSIRELIRNVTVTAFTEYSHYIRLYRAHQMLAKAVIIPLFQNITACKLKQTFALPVCFFSEN